MTKISRFTPDHLSYQEGRGQWIGTSLAVKWTFGLIGWKIVVHSKENSFIFESIPCCAISLRLLEGFCVKALLLGNGEDALFIKLCRNVKSIDLAPQVQLGGCRFLVPVRSWIRASVFIINASKAVFRTLSSCLVQLFCKGSRTTSVYSSIGCTHVLYVVRGKETSHSLVKDQVQ